MAQLPGARDVEGASEDAAEKQRSAGRHLRVGGGTEVARQDVASGGITSASAAKAGSSGNADDSLVFDVPRVRVTTDEEADDAFFETSMHRHHHHHSGSGHHHHHHHHRRHRRRKLVLKVAAIVMLVLVAAAALEGLLLYRSAQTVKEQAKEAVAEASTMRTALTSGDSASFGQSAQTISEKAAAINDEVNGTPWKVLASVPVVGQDVRSVQTLADTVQGLSDDALVPISQNLEGMSFSSLLGGDYIDVNTLLQVAQATTDAAPALEEASATLDALPTAHISQVESVIESVREPVDSASGAVNGLTTIMPVLPQILGANGETRTYLVVGMTPVEIRSAGGFPGSWGTITVTDGRIEMGEFSNITGTRGYEPVLTEEQAALFHPGDNPGSATFDPNWPGSARTCDSYWSAILNQSEDGEFPEEGTFSGVDGVIGITPIFVQHMLGLVGGSVTSYGITSDGSSFARAMMYDSYVELGPSGLQDAYGVEAAQMAFDEFTAGLGTIQPLELLDVLGEDAEAHALQVWMANDAEEQAIVELGASGRISTDPSGTPEVGVYLNNSSYSKLEWWLDIGTQVGAANVNADGTATYRVTIDLVNTMTKEEESTLSTFMRVNNPTKGTEGTMLEHGFLYAPAGGSLTVTYASQDIGIGDYTIDGLQVKTFDVSIDPEQTTTIELEVTVPAEASGDLTVRTTPTCTDVRNS